MSGLDVTVNTDRADVDVGLLGRAVEYVLRDGDVDRGEVSVTLLGDDEIRKLNREWLDHDHPTDVLSFALEDGDGLTGDVYVGVDQAARQASELGVPLAEELVRLAVHGALHLLGHDHPDGEERSGSPMFVLQERYVRELLKG